MGRQRHSRCRSQKWGKKTQKILILSQNWKKEGEEGERRRKREEKKRS